MSAEAAIKTTKQWLEGLQRPDLKGAVNTTQVSWRFMASQGDGVEATLDRYRKGLPVDEILSVGPAEPLTTVCIDVKFKIKSDGEIFVGNARLWCESAPMKPNKRGAWGVNPPSVFRRSIQRAP